MNKKQNMLNLPDKQDIDKENLHKLFNNKDNELFAKYDKKENVYFLNKYLRIQKHQHISSKDKQSNFEMESVNKRK